MESIPSDFQKQLALIREVFASKDAVRLRELVQSRAQFLENVANMIIVKLRDPDTDLPEKLKEELLVLTALE